MDASAIKSQMHNLKWYHTVDLGQGIETPGEYDHRPYLHYYGLPEELSGKRVLDIGAASGFFSFELERRGAKVVAVDLPDWMAHDLSPTYELETTLPEAESYLLDPFEFAKAARNASVERRLLNIYDLSPDTIGTFDLVFCGSVLLHLTDPVRALWRIQSVTKGVAIITTGIYPDSRPEPIARFWGHRKGTTWWLPNRPCFESMIQASGFAGWEWFSDFSLDYRDGRTGTYHGIIRAWNDRDSLDLPSVLAPANDTSHSAPPLMLHHQLAQKEAELARLQVLLKGYEQGRFMRLMRGWRRLRQKLGGYR